MQRSAMRRARALLSGSRSRPRPRRAAARSPGGTCKLYVGCPADGQVELCTFPAMGHCWAGGPGLYGCSTYAEATKLEWQFWKRYAW